MNREKAIMQNGDSDERLPVAVPVEVSSAEPVSAFPVLQAQVVNEMSGITHVMREFTQTTLPGSVVHRLQQNERVLANNRELLHKKVVVDLKDSRGEFYNRPDTILLVETTEQGQFKFNLQDLNGSDERPVWQFEEQDLSHFVFAGDLYQNGFFSNCNLSNADLSKMQMTVFSFIGHVILDGTKFPNNILDAGVLFDDNSRRIVIEQIVSTYKKEARILSLNRFAFFNAGNDIILKLRSRAMRDPSGASARTLRIHGLSVV